MNESTVTALPVSNSSEETPVREDVNALTMTVSLGGGDPMKEMIKFTIALLSPDDRVVVSRVIPMKFAATVLCRNNLSNCKESQNVSINDETVMYGLKVLSLRTILKFSCTITDVDSLH